MKTLRNILFPEQPRVLRYARAWNIAFRTAHIGVTGILFGGHVFDVTAERLLVWLYLSINFDPTGQFLYSCNQRGDNIAVFRVDRKSGGLIFTGQYTPVGNPSIIVFLDLTKES